MTEAPALAATRAAYDTVAVDYAELLQGELESKPLDRALLGAFAELVQRAGSGPVGDLGCGPGRITAHLRTLGVDAFGVDLSPGMVDVARRSHPHLRFEVGSITDLQRKDASLAGVVAWYSIIHTPPALLPSVFSELERVLQPGAPLLLAFQAGEDEHVHRTEAYGHPVSLDSYRLSVDAVVALLSAAGIPAETRILREPQDAYETVPQAYVLARKPAG